MLIVWIYWVAGAEPTEHRWPQTTWGTLKGAVSLSWHCYVQVPEGKNLGQALVKYIYLNIKAVKPKQAYFTITLIIPICFHTQWSIYRCFVQRCLVIPSWKFCSIPLQQTNNTIQSHIDMFCNFTHSLVSWNTSRMFENRRWGQREKRDEEHGKKRGRNHSLTQHTK